MKKLAVLLVCVLMMALALPAMADEEIVLYHTATDDQMAIILEAFAQVHPEIKVTTYRATAEEMGATMGMELMAQNPQFDLFIGSNTVTIPLMNQYSDAFLAWEPENLENIQPGLLDGTGVTYPIGVGYYVIIYNTNLIDAADAPTAFRDLIDDKYENAIVMADPSSSGSIYTYLWFVTQFLADQEGFGWDHFAKLAALNTMLVSSHGTLGETVALGERKIGIQVLSTAMSAYKRGDPIAIVYPAEGCPCELNVAAISSVTQHADAVQTFLNYLLSDEGQAVVGNSAWPPVLSKMEGFTFADGTNPADLTLWGGDTQWIVENKPEILEQFKQVTGN